jgi:hypothetical protein
MPMRRAMLLAFCLMLIGISPQDSARAQSSATPPVSLAPPLGASPHASAKSARPKGQAAAVTTDGRSSAAAGRDPSPPAIGGPAATPHPATDYDGFSATTDEHDAPSRVTPPARSRAANGSGLDAQSLIDQDDEALKRKLTICQKCK